MSERRVMTRRISIDPESPSTRLIEEAASIVRAGGLVAYPTETFYGLGADPFAPVPAERVFTVKGRPGGLPLPLIVQDESILVRCVRDWRGAAATLAAAFWPGALTLVLPAVRTLPTRLLAGGETVGVRITPHPVAAALARAAARAIIATSASRSGQAAPDSARQPVESLEVHVAF